MTSVLAFLRRWPVGETTDSLGTAWLMAGACVLLGVGLMPLNPDAGTVAVVGALLVAVVALLVGRRPTLTVDARSVVTTLGVFVVVEGVVLAALPIFPNLGYQMALVLLSVVAAHATLIESRWWRAEVGLVLAGYFALMCWMLASTGLPPTDVVPFQQESAGALLSGVNPYSLRFDNVFGEGTPYYARELQVGDRLDFGFVYPPLSLLMAIPGHVIAGDYRYGAAAAVTATAALVAFARPSRIATGSAMLIIVAPITQLVLYWGWSEPFMVVLFAATAFVATRSAASTPFAIGLLVAIKQHAAPMLLVGLFLLHSVRLKVGARSMMLVPIVVAVTTVIPFALWDLRALIHSTVTVQLLQPFRMDAITIPALLARFDLAPTAPILGFVFGALALVALLRWAPRTVAGFCYATAIFYTVFFLFNKHAFLNYYFFVLVTIACGMATTRPGRSDDAVGGLLPTERVVG